MPGLDQVALEENGLRRAASSRLRSLASPPVVSWPTLCSGFAGADWIGAAT